jgi:hypothetical protein
MGTPEVPLEHAHETIEHHAEHSSEPWIMGVALTAAILAAMAAVTALSVEHFAEESMHELLKSSDLWNESQAESIKEKEIETQQLILESQNKKLKPDTQEKLDRFSKNKDKHRDEAKEEQDKSEAHVRKHLPLSLGLTMYQVAIAIGAISVLTKRREFWFLSIALGVIATGFLSWGLIV